jgi:hypothetical protein
MNTTVAKWFFIAGTLLFADWIIMIIFGCIASMCKANDAFFCSVYCKAGIALLVITGFLIVYFSALSKSKRR